VGGEMSELPASHDTLVGSQGSITPHVQSLPKQCEGFSAPQVELPQVQLPQAQSPQGSSTPQVQSPPKQCYRTYIRGTDLATYRSTASTQVTPSTQATHSTQGSCVTQTAVSWHTSNTQL